jgi:hypothetical protein
MSERAAVAGRPRVSAIRIVRFRARVPAMLIYSMM